MLAVAVQRLVAGRVDSVTQRKHTHERSQQSAAELSDGSPQRDQCTRELTWVADAVIVLRARPRPDSQFGRRGLLKGAAGAAALGIALPRGGWSAYAQASPATPSATGEVTLGSNYSDEVPKAACRQGRCRYRTRTSRSRSTRSTTIHSRNNITTYLQNPDDVMTWFAGYRMRFFAAQGLVGDITDVWDAGLNDQVGEGFKVASTGDDGKQYFVPTTYYCLGHPLPQEPLRGERLDRAREHGRADDAGHGRCRARASSRSHSPMTAAGRRWAPSTSSISA